MFNPMRMSRLLELSVLLPALLLGIAVQAEHARAADTQTAVVAGGCFWCVEADFEKVEGVSEVVSGFAGGTVPDPSYRQVVRGGTGHLEVAEIHYDPDQVTYAQLMHLFLRSIDPFDNGGQFCDRGESYAPAIFPANDAEREAAEDAIAAAEQTLERELKVPVRDDAPFYPAEEYHQDYYKKNDLILTRFGPESKQDAYKKYRAACGRDERVEEVWGDEAPFTGG